MKGVGGWRWRLSVSGEGAYSNIGRHEVRGGLGGVLGDSWRRGAGPSSLIAFCHQKRRNSQAFISPPLIFLLLYLPPVFSFSPSLSSTLVKTLSRRVNREMKEN